MIEKIAEIYAVNAAERSVNFFAVLHPLAALVRNTEKVHNGEVIAEHIVDAYRFFYSVENSSVGSSEYVDYSYDFSV